MTRPDTGTPETVMPGLRRVLAPNPGPMTHWGTNSFILGEGSVAVIDPGPEDAGHLQALLTAISGETVTHILITHAHADHSPLARRLAQETGAPIYGFGAFDAGRSPAMQALAEAGLAGGGEGVDREFIPDHTLREGDRVIGDDWTLDILHTPGHFAGHLSFRFNNCVISGDHVMDWSSSLVSPPDGDMRAFMDTSMRLRDLGIASLFPAHGNQIDDPADRLNWLIRHRKKRELAILDALSHVPQTIPEITGTVYADIPATMLPAASRNVIAHLVDLVDQKLVKVMPKLSIEAKFTRA